MMVLPYITVSIVASLGRSGRPSLPKVGSASPVAVIGGLWLLALSFAFLVPLNYSDGSERLVFQLEPRRSATRVQLHRFLHSLEPVDLLANVVPAVVLFSHPGHRRGRCRQPGAPARRPAGGQRRDLQSTRSVTRLTPYGLFAIAANAAGTLSLEQWGRLQIYLVAYVAIGVLVSLWVLPELVAVLTPIRAGISSANRVMRLHYRLRSPATSSSSCQEGLDALASRTLLLVAEQPPETRSLAGLSGKSWCPPLLHPVSTGKLLSLSFILFAGWFADTPVPLAEVIPQLALAGSVSPSSGSLNWRAVFRSDLFRIPSDTFASACSRDRRGQLAGGVAGRGSPHIGSRPSRLVRRDRPPPLASRTALVGTQASLRFSSSS